MRSAPGLRPFLRLLTRPRFLRGFGRRVVVRAGVSLGLDGCEVRLCDPCARLCPCVLCVSRLPPGLFTGSELLGYSPTHNSHTRRDAYDARKLMRLYGSEVRSVFSHNPLALPLRDA